MPGQMRFPRGGLRIPTLLVAVVLAGGRHRSRVARSGSEEDRSAEGCIVRVLQQMIRIDSQFAKGVVHNHKEMVAFLEKGAALDWRRGRSGPSDEPFEAPDHRGLAVSTQVIPQTSPSSVRAAGRAGKPVLGLETLYNNVVIGDCSQWTVDRSGGRFKDARSTGGGRLTRLRREVHRSAACTQRVRGLARRRPCRDAHAWERALPNSRCPGSLHTDRSSCR